MAYSVQQTANYAKFLGLLLTLFGYNVSEEKLVAFVGVAMIFVSIVISGIDRYKKHDITWWGKRK